VYSFHSPYITPTFPIIQMLHDPTVDCLASSKSLGQKGKHNCPYIRMDTEEQPYLCREPSAHQLFYHTIPQPDPSSHFAILVKTCRLLSQDSLRRHPIPHGRKHTTQINKTLQLLPSCRPLGIMIQRLTFSPVPGTWGRNEKNPSHNKNGYQRTIPFTQKAFGIAVVPSYNSAARPMILSVLSPSVHMMMPWPTFSPGSRNLPQRPRSNCPMTRTDMKNNSIFTESLSHTTCSIIQFRS